MKVIRFAAAVLPFRAGVLALAVFAALGASTTLVGCGEDASKKTGDLVKPDAAEAQRQKEMADFYKSNPLPKPKK